MLYTPRINYQPDVGHDMDPFIYWPGKASRCLNSRDFEHIILILIILS